MKKALIIIFSVLIFDQIIKIWIKSNMFFGENLSVIPGFFQITFIENNGMAFGMELGGVWGKLILTVFRLIAASAIFYYLYNLIKKGTSTLMIVCISLIFAGAVGNIIDSLFYGKMFSASCGNPWLRGVPCDEIARVFPKEGGYGNWLFGHVVDMFQFTARWPSWVPNLGGKQIFPAIFNLADASISVGVMLMIIFNKRLFGKKTDEVDATEHKNLQESV